MRFAENELYLGFGRCGRICPGSPGHMFEEDPSHCQQVLNPCLQEVWKFVPWARRSCSSNRVQASRPENSPVLQEEQAVQEPAAAVDPAAPVPPRTHEPAEVVLEVPGGKITSYRQGYFTAQCMAAHHGWCVLTRSAQPARQRAQGRPLGLLMCWLGQGHGLPQEQTTGARISGPTTNRGQLAEDNFPSFLGAKNS